MLLSVSVRLGKKHFKDDRLYRLQRIIQTISEDVEDEIPLPDTKGRWSYTFTVEAESLEAIKSTLQNNGRYQIIKVVDVSTNTTIHPKTKVRSK